MGLLALTVNRTRPMFILDENKKRNFHIFQCIMTSFYWKSDRHHVIIETYLNIICFLTFLSSFIMLFHCNTNHLGTERRTIYKLTAIFKKTTKSNAKIYSYLHSKEWKKVNYDTSDLESVHWSFLQHLRIMHLNKVLYVVKVVSAFCRGMNFA